MRRRAVSSSSIALCLMMALAAGTAQAVDGQAGAAPLAQRLVIPPLSPAESRAAFAPVAPAPSLAPSPALPAPDRTATLGDNPLPVEPEAAAPAPIPTPVPRPFNA